MLTFPLTTVTSMSLLLTTLPLFHVGRQPQHPPRLYQTPEDTESDRPVPASGGRHTDAGRSLLDRLQAGQHLHQLRHHCFCGFHADPRDQQSQEERSGKARSPARASRRGDAPAANPRLAEEITNEAQPAGAPLGDLFTLDAPFFFEVRAIAAGSKLQVPAYTFGSIHNRTRCRSFPLPPTGAKKGRTLPGTPSCSRPIVMGRRFKSDFRSTGWRS